MSSENTTDEPKGEGKGPDREPIIAAIMASHSAPRSAVTADAASLIALAQSTMLSDIIELEDGSGIAFVSDGNGGLRREAIPALNPKLPDFIVGNATFNEPRSMMEYINRFKLSGAIVIADLAQRRFKAMLDYHERGGHAGLMEPTTKHNKHSATLLTPYDEDYAAWKAILTKEIPQAEFGIWFEDMLHTVYVPNDDELEDVGTKNARAGLIDPGELLDMLNTINIHRNVAVSSVVNNRDGTIKVRYEEEDAPEVMLPRDVLLSMPVFAGTERILLLAKLRYRVAQGGAVFFKWAIPGLPNIERFEFRKIGDDIVERANVPVLYGQTGS